MRPVSFRRLGVVGSEVRTGGQILLSTPFFAILSVVISQVLPPLCVPLGLD